MVKRYLTRTFSSLATYNYRLYFIGQWVSQAGTFMQGVAQAWLVYTLTNSAAQVGIVSALQFGPVLVLGAYGGIVADRFSKRHILYFTQAGAGLLAIVLWLLVATHVVQIWMIYVLALLFGIVNSFDNPARQTFVYEMVGRENIGNAITLNSTQVNLSRIIGPGLAGLLIATVGIASCFLLNGLSFGAVIVALAMMRRSELHHVEPVKAEKGQLREGFSYVVHSPILRDALVMMALIGTLTFEFQVSLAALSRVTFSAGAGGLSLLMLCMGVGAVIGGLVLAGVRRPRKRTLIGGALAFGITVGLVAVSPTLAVAAAAMVLVGAASITFTSVTNTTLQLNSEPHMRGRVMSLWSIAFLGSTVVGAPVVGWIADRFSPEWGLGIGAIAALAAGLYGLIDVGKRRAAETAGEPAAEELAEAVLAASELSEGDPA